MKFVRSNQSWVGLVAVVMMATMTPAVAGAQGAGEPQLPPRPPAPEAASPTATGLASPTPRNGDPYERAEEEARASDTGRARVIIELAGDWQPGRAAGDSPQSKEQARGVERERRGVEADLQGTPHDIVRRYDRLPFLALSASPQAIDRLRTSEHVADVHLDTLSLPALDESGPLLGADTVNAAGLTGAGQAVAILDTGVQSDHPFLGGRVVAEACFASGSPVGSGDCPGGTTEAIGPGSAVPCAPASCDHGTHVAGIAAGDGPDFRGVAPEAGIIAIQVFSEFSGQQDCGEPQVTCVASYTSDQLAALQYLLELSETVTIASANLSLGGGSYSVACDGDPRKAVIDSLATEGIATAIASGNDSSNTSVSAPGCISTAVTVGSTTTADEVSAFSNSHSLVDLLAPGHVITSSVLGGGFAAKNGTSMATPQVAGAWAVMRQATPTAPVTGVQSALEDSGIPVLDTDNGVTRPRISLLGALGGSLTPCPDDPEEPDDTPASATVLAPSMASTGIRCPDNDDTFRLPGMAGTTVDLTLTFDHEAGDLDLVLIDGTGAQLDAAVSTTDGETLSHTYAAQGEIFAHVVGKTTGETAAYTLRARSSLCPPNEPSEPNDSSSAAAALPGSGEAIGVSCSLGAYDDDWWSFTAQAGDDLHIELHGEPGAGEMDLLLYGPSGAEIAGTTPGDGRSRDAIDHVATASGTYLVVPWAVYAGVYPYVLQVEGATTGPGLTGLFEPYNEIASGSWTNVVAMGDVTGDGFDDVVTVDQLSSAAGQLVVHPGTGAGLGTPTMITVTGAESIDIGDVDGDGLDDVVTGSAAGLEVFLQQSDGSLGAATTYTTDLARKVRIGDVTGNGRNDIVGIGWGADLVGIWAQDGTGNLPTSPTTTAVDLGGYNDLELGDMNDDGRLDVVAMSGQIYATPDVSILHQDTNGQLATPVTYDVPGGDRNANGIGVGDVTGDGRADLVVSHGGNMDAAISVFAQAPAVGGLDAPHNTAALDIPEPVELADVDGDGLLDVVVAHGGHNRLGVFRRQADGTLGSEELSTIPYASHYNPHGLALGDVTGDGMPDAALADYNHGLVLLENGQTPPPPPPGPANDDLADAEPIVAPDIFDGSREFDTTGATREDGEPVPHGPQNGSLWWSFTGPQYWSARAFVGAGFDASDDLALALYRDTGGGDPSFADLELLASTVNPGGSFDDVIDAALAPDETIYVQVYGIGNASGTGDLSFWATAVNDRFEDAIAMEPATGGTVEGTNDYAGNEWPEEPDGVNGPPRTTVWWSWTAPADGQVIFDTSGSQIPTTLDVFSNTGSGLDTLALVDGAVGVGEPVKVPVTEGQQFHVRVDEASGPGATTAYGVIAVNWCLDDVHEDNDSLETAAPMTSGEPIDAVLCDEADYYSIEAQAGETVTANLTWDPADGPMSIQLLDAGGNVLDEVLDSDRGSESVSWGAGGAMSVRVAGTSPTIYTLTAVSVGLVRGEEDVSAFAFSSGWFEQVNGGFSGGAARSTVTVGSSFEVLFSGSVVRLVGFRAPNRGMAEIAVDGEVIETVDMWSSSYEFGQELFSAAGLGGGTHRLTVSFLGAGVSTASTVYLTVDAIEAEGVVALVRGEEDVSAFAFSSGWFEQVNGGFSGGAARSTVTVGSSFEVLFSGSVVRLVGFRAPNRGVAEIAVDGEVIETVDMWSSSYEFGQELFSAAGLGGGTHRLTVSFLGAGVSTASTVYLTVDAIEAEGVVALVRGEEDVSAFAFSSGWFEQVNGGFSGGAARSTVTVGSSFEVLFSGSVVRLVGFRAPNRGVAEIAVDGEVIETVDMWSSSYEFGQELFSAAGLGGGTHRLTVSFLGAGVSTASTVYLTVDAIEAEGVVALVRGEEDVSAFAFSSGWFEQVNGGFSGGAARSTVTVGSSFEVLFSGSVVRLVGFRAPNRGVAEIAVDGEVIETVDMWSSSYEFGQELFSAAGLGGGTHRLTVSFLGAGVSTASTVYLTVDAIEAEGFTADSLQRTTDLT